MTYKRDYYVASLAYDGDKPVGMLLLLAFDIQFFVLPEYRHKGIATQLFEETGKVHNLTHKVLNRGEDEVAKSFMEHHQIPMTLHEMRMKSLTLQRTFKDIHAM